MNNYEQGVWIQLGEHSPAPPLRFQNSFSIALKGKKTIVQNRKNIILKNFLFLNLILYPPLNMRQQKCSVRINVRIHPQTAWAQNLKQSNILKTSFKIWVSRMGLGRVVNINIFVMKYYFIQFVYILNFFRIS